MKLAITSDSKDDVLTLFDTDTEAVLKIQTDERGLDNTSNQERPPHRPFGITWNEDTIFIANRSNLLIYDSDLKFVKSINGILDQNTHQIVYYENQIIVTMTRQDCIRFINLEDYSHETFHIDDGWGNFQPTHKYHVNSVVVRDNLLYVMLHNRSRKPSQILVFNLETKEKESLIDTDLKSSHGIYLNGDIIACLDTHKQRIKFGSKSIYEPSFGGFMRGMAGDKNTIAVGHFPPQERHYRGFGDAHISIFENKKFVKEYRIDNIGAINDIRRIDGEDLCHHNKYPFPFKFDV
mgnify:FL=1